MTKLEDPVLLLTLVWASYTDWRERRILNLTTGGAAVLGLILGAIQGYIGLVSALQGFAMGLLIFWPFYALGGMGGGDVKLLGAIGALKGPHFAVETAIWASLLGAAWAFLLLLWRPKTPFPTLPYGIAIALGALVVLGGGGTSMLWV